MPSTRPVSLEDVTLIPGDIVQSSDDSIYIIKDIFVRDDELRAHLDTVIETHWMWTRLIRQGKSFNKSLPVSLLTKITHAEGLDE